MTPEERVASLPSGVFYPVGASAENALLKLFREMEAEKIAAVEAERERIVLMIGQELLGRPESEQALILDLQKLIRARGQQEGSR